jgi:hypothetical protein
MSKGDDLGWLPEAIRLVELDRAAGLPNMASDIQEGIDAAIDDGRITEPELLAAAREAWFGLPAELQDEKRNPWWTRY